MKKKVILAFLATALLATSCKYKFDDEEEQKPKDAVLQKLAGRTAAGKTWTPVGGPYQVGVGSPTNFIPDYFNFPEGVTGSDAWVNGTLQNSYTFVTPGSKFIPKNNQVTAHWAFANKYFGLNQEQYLDAVVSDPNHKQTTFKLVNENNGIGTGYTIEITGGSYIGRAAEGQRKYQIMSITEDTLKLRNLFQELPETYESAWYSTYVAN